MSSPTIEQEILAKGLNAPRVTPADIEAEIAAEHYFRADQGVKGARLDDGRPLGTVHKPLYLLTFCVLVLRNGFTVTGESACVSPENFDAAIGRRVAREKAIEKVWPLLGFRLRDRLAAPPVLSGADLTPEELAEVARAGDIASVSLRTD